MAAANGTHTSTRVAEWPLKPGGMTPDTTYSIRLTVT